jgi:hypothetical protein
MLLSLLRKNINKKKKIKKNRKPQKKVNKNNKYHLFSLIVPNSTKLKVNINGDIITLFKKDGIWYADFGRVGGNVIRMGE